MTRLDHNRARSALAKKAGVGNDDVTCVTIWGNHSNTQYPDFTNAKIKGKPATEVITDRAWLETTFVPQVPEPRRQAVIKKRGSSSSALSAANGALDHVKSWLKPTPANDWVSMAVVSKGEYGVPAGLVFGYPCKSDGKGNFSDRRGRQARRLRPGEVQDHAQGTGRRTGRGEGFVEMIDRHAIIAAGANQEWRSMKNTLPPRLRKFSAARQRRLDDLLDKNSEGTITPSEAEALKLLVGRGGSVDG